MSTRIRQLIPTYDSSHFLALLENGDVCRARTCTVDGGDSIALGPPLDHYDEAPEAAAPERPGFPTPAPGQRWTLQRKHGKEPWKTAEPPLEIEVFEVEEHMVGDRSLSFWDRGRFCETGISTNGGGRSRFILVP